MSQPTFSRRALLKSGGALVVSFVRTAVIQFWPEVELAVLYLIAAGVLLVRPTGLFGSPA